MVPLYALFVTVLAALRRVLVRHAARYERKYTTATLAAEKAARASQGKPGNANQVDPLAAAKRQYELGQLAEYRDRLEGKYVSAQARADRVGGLVGRLVGWKGRLVPYLFGVIDVALVMLALHYLKLPHGLTVESLKEWVEALKASL